VTDQSALGQLLSRFGFDVRKNEGKDVDWSVLTGKVTFVTTTEETSKGKFARVNPDSVAPATTGSRRR
jgi:hypothetical protein